MLFQRIGRHFNTRSKLDLTRKMLYYLRQQINQLDSAGRQMRTWLYFKNAGVRIGRHVLLKGLSYNMQTGQGIEVYDFCIFEMVGDDAKISIGNECLFSYGVVLSCKNEISIGNHVMVGEYTSIRDTSHIYHDFSRPMKQGADVSAPVRIGDDVWIGRGCIIMPGTVIENGAVIAANSVVKGRVEKDSIHGGSPARFIKRRYN